jgi:hypothetical protein
MFRDALHATAEFAAISAFLFSIFVVLVAVQ